MSALPPPSGPADDDGKDWDRPSQPPSGPPGSSPWASAPWGSGHPSPDVVDGLLDVDLGPRAEEAGPRRTGGRRSTDEPVPMDVLAAAHVLECARCRAVLDDMRAVRGLLRRQVASVPPPPEDLQARIAAALAAEGSSRQLVSSGRRTRRVRRAVLALAAVAVVATGAGAVVLGTEPGAPAAMSPGSARTAPTPSDESSVPDTDGRAGTASATSGAGPSSGPVSTGHLVVLATGTDYELDDLEAQVPALLSTERSVSAATGADAGPQRQGARGSEGERGEGGEGGEGGGDGATSAPTRVVSTGPLGSPEALERCMEALGRGHAAPLAVDESTYEGKSAAVVVLPPEDEDASGHVEVWVLRPACEDGAEGMYHFELLRL